MKGVHGPRSNGFSLLEVMIAVAILAMALLTLINFQGQTMFRVGRAEKLTQATFLAGEKMAEVMLQIEKEYVQQRVFPDDKSDSGSFEEPFENYKWEWRLRTVEIPVPEGEGEQEGGGMMTGMMQMVANQIKD
ncbi:MAG: prepilin-type N-terminal cleavage/methylation domain-containing protein, partial [Deltaproteobacteria bacterium]|nr:prepilin-type N-terminal cleavage/methylation domain-containing protein [Deltaproteobacteria bacterium]